MSQICLHIPDRPTSREIARLNILTRALGSQAISLCESERNREETPSAVAERIGGEQALSTESLKRSKNSESFGRSTIISLAEQRPTTADLESTACEKIWWFCEGDPRRDPEGTGLHCAVAAGRSHVAMTLRELGHEPKQERILAFADASRRPWDSLPTLQRRLDAFLPQLIMDADNNDAQGADIRPHPCRPTREGARPAGTSFKRLAFVQRITDLKYFIHLAVSLLHLSPRLGKTHVILLHNPAPDILDEILTALGKYGRFVAYPDVVQGVLNGQSCAPGFVVTFDDGYKQNISLLDVLEEHSCKAMFFLNSAPIDSKQPAWFMNHEKDFRSLKKHLKTLDYQSFLTSIASSGLTEPCPLRGRFGLTADEVRTLLDHGHSVGVHTLNHPFLTRLSSHEIRVEINECAIRLREIAESPSMEVDLAYPDGDYNPRVLAELEDMNVRSAATTHPGPLTGRVYPLTIPRSSIEDIDYPGVALFKLMGPYRFLKRLQAGLGRDA